MSVVPMKLLTIAGPLERFDDVVRACVIDQEFHPENALQLMRGVGGLRPLDPENPYAAMLRRAVEVADEAGIPLDYAPFDPDAPLEDQSAYFDGLLARVADLHRQQEELEHQMDEARSMVDQLQNLRGLDVKLDELWGLDHARFRYGYLPREPYDGFRDAMDAEEDLFFVPTTLGARRVYGVYFTTREAHHRVDSLMNSLHFVRIRLEEPPHGTVDAATAELNARVKSVIRRKQADGDMHISIGNLSVFPDRHEASIDGKELKLNRKEFDLLYYFVINPDRLINKTALAESVWGDRIDQADSLDFIYSQVKNLRKKMKTAGATPEIKAVYGFGYKLVSEPEP